jgi:hypothetical protein
MKEVVTASEFERQQVYRWLFKSARQYAQNRRIQTLVEQEAFEKIHQAWQQLGYPFNTFTPSYASSIGASGDRPAALAELMGILLNEGIRYPTHRFDSVNFAVNTPYELRMALPEALGRRVLAPEVAAAARKALIGVVENGTAKRIDGAYKLLDGTKLIIAGKTGTGDHRRHINGAKGRLIGEEVVSRSATFAFILGDRHFGTLTAYVKGPNAARYRFTSALPVQVLKSLEPTLAPLIAQAYGQNEHGTAKPVVASNIPRILPQPRDRRHGVSSAPFSDTKARGFSPLPAMAASPLIKQTTQAMTPR